MPPAVAAAAVGTTAVADDEHDDCGCLWPPCADCLSAANSPAVAGPSVGGPPTTLNDDVCAVDAVAWTGCDRLTDRSSATAAADDAVAADARDDDGGGCFLFAGDDVAAALPAVVHPVALPVPVLMLVLMLVVVVMVVVAVAVTVQFVAAAVGCCTQHVWWCVSQSLC